MRETIRPDVLDFAPAPADMLADVLAGLSRRPKRLPSRYLYDAAGADLFERICELDEYDLARTETAILAGAAQEIAGRIGPRALLFEPGSGAGHKIRLLLAALDHLFEDLPERNDLRVLHRLASRSRLFHQLLVHGSRL